MMVLKIDKNRSNPLKIAGTVAITISNGNIWLTHLGKLLFTR